MPACGAITFITPCTGARTPVTRDLRVYSPNQKKRARVKAMASAAMLMNVKEIGRMSTMRPSHEVARASPAPSGTRIGWASR
jgi:hypothetical protein